MKAVGETFRKMAVAGDLKMITIQTDSSAATGFTIDLNSDVADGKGQVVEEILNTLLQDDAGADKTCTWVPGTGIITLGTISTDTTTTYTFASDVGVSFEEIPFRFDLARGSTNTNSPILEWFAVEYMRITPVVWGYQFTVYCTKVYAKTAPADLFHAIRTATALST